MESRWMPRFSASKTSTGDVDVGPPRPLQLVSLDNMNDTLKLEEDNLKILCNELRRAEADAVSIIAIMGPHCSGKSFFLNFVLAYLQFLADESDSTKDLPKKDSQGFPVPSWLQKGNEAGCLIGGFPWTSSPGISGENTEGLCVWSRPFVIKKTRNRSIGLVLMDTQGLWDGQMSKRQSAMLTGCIALLSSTVIYNISNRLSHEKIDQLEYFMTYAQSVFSLTPESGAHFGHLEFLIRDWSWYEDEYTMEQCKEMMQQHLQQILTNLKLKDRPTRLTGQFRSIGCTGLVHPGKRVAKKNFKGEYKDMNSEFLQLVDNFLKTLSTSSFTLPSTIFGSELFSQSLQKTVQNVVKTFNDSGVMACSIQDSFTQLELMSFRDILVRKFHDDLQKEFSVDWVADPGDLRTLGETKTIELIQEFKRKLEALGVTDDGLTTSFATELAKGFRKRELDNLHVVEKALVKLASTPFVGVVIYCAILHNIILYLALGIGGITHCHNRSRRDGLSVCNPTVLLGMGYDVKTLAHVLHRDLAAMQIACKRCVPGGLRDQKGRDTVTSKSPPN